MADDAHTLAVLERTVRKQQDEVKDLEAKLREARECLHETQLAVDRLRARLNGLADPTPSSIRRGDGTSVGPSTSVGASDRGPSASSPVRREPSNSSQSPSSASLGVKRPRVDVDGLRPGDLPRRSPPGNTAALASTSAPGATRAAQPGSSGASARPDGRQGGGMPPSPSAAGKAKGVGPSSQGASSARGGAPSAPPPVKREPRQLLWPVGNPQTTELGPLVRSGKLDNPPFPRFSMAPAYVPSEQKRRLRTLVLNPANVMQCAVSSLDCTVNLWNLQKSGKAMSLRGSVDAAPSRRWPEDLAWHPGGGEIIAVYESDGQSNSSATQLSVINIEGPRMRCIPLPQKPHLKGVINCVRYLPWGPPPLVFATGGSDHGVVLWSEKESEDGGESIKTHKVLHRTHHTAAVYGVDGLRTRKVVVSAGADKRVIGVDAVSQRMVFCHVHESKAVAVAVNPVDFNLVLTQTGSPGSQLTLFDVRQPKTVLHAFGWEQATSDVQSALINAAWSPNGLFVSAGSADPAISLFDIRYAKTRPFKVLRAHDKRVFVGLWHPTLPLLISISSDLSIGLHST